MAVYTHLGAEVLAEVIAGFDVGALVSVKGIAEGISNSNWLVETTGASGDGARFILTMYERRIAVDDLPFFLGLLDHLAARGCPVPQTIHDSRGRLFQMLDGKAIALIEFLPGVSVSTPTAEQAFSVGAALAGLHVAAGDYAGRRENAMGPGEWRRLASALSSEDFAAIDRGLAEQIGVALPRILATWPTHLPCGTIHADLFPDNVLMLGNRVTGLIDFYFACSDILAYDLAVTHAAWCFSADGRDFHGDLSDALLAGYRSQRRLSEAETAALPVLAQGASIRFALTRAWDWIHTPADALVTRKDPLAFARRLAFYGDPDQAALFA